jgi:hypothetical protein
MCVIRLHERGTVLVVPTQHVRRVRQQLEVCWFERLLPVRARERFERVRPGPVRVGPATLFKRSLYYHRFIVDHVAGPAVPHRVHRLAVSSSGGRAPAIEAEVTLEADTTATTHKPDRLCRAATGRSRSQRRDASGTTSAQPRPDRRTRCYPHRQKVARRSRHSRSTATSPARRIRTAAGIRRSPPPEDRRPRAGARPVVSTVNELATHVLHRPCRVVAARSRSEPVHSATECLL